MPRAKTDPRFQSAALLPDISPIIREGPSAARLHGTLALSATLSQSTTEISMETILLIVLLVLLLGGGGWYGRGRWYGRRPL